MNILYGIELCDTDGKAIVPGFGGAHYESETPFPVPHPGDFILSMGKRYKVENITYEYKFSTESDQFISAATIMCRPVPE